MKCPDCNSSYTKVIETRSTKDGTGTRRRRDCPDCHFRFSTVESIVLNLPIIVKKQGLKQAFSRSKILSGLTAACQKRPVTSEQLATIADKTCQWASQLPVAEISSKDVGIFVMEQLKQLDKVASIRFASVHQSFNDIEEFVNHLERNF